MSAFAALESVPLVPATLLALAAVVIALGAAATARGGETFYFSDRSVTNLPAGLAIAAAFLSAAPFLGLTGTVFSLGSDGLSWIVGMAAGLVLMGVLIAPGFRATGAATVPEALAARYGGRTVPLLATLIAGGCALLLLTVQLMAIGMLAEAAAGVARAHAIGAAALVIAAVLGLGGARAATWVLVLLLLGTIAAFVLPLGAFAFLKHDSVAGHIAYGQTLQELRNLEVDMIGEGLADPITLKPHVRPFLQVDHTNTLALILCVMAGTAVLPHVVMRHAVTRGVRQTRFAAAWALLAVAVVLTAVPAYAALSKHELYRFVAKGVPLTETPEAFVRHDVAVHGVPLRLLDAVIDAVRNSATDAKSTGAALNKANTRAAADWAALKPQVHSALVEAAKAAGEATPQHRFEIWRNTLLPVAAAAAGNKTGKLTQSSLGLDPARAAFLAFDLASLPAHWGLVFALGGVLAATATAIATAWALALALTRDMTIIIRGHRNSTISGTAAVRAAVVTATAAAAGLALTVNSDLTIISAWVFSIAAAGLLPALLAGFWWRRATSAGAVAGMAAGLAVTLGYIGGTHFAPVPMFAATWQLSDAGAMAASKVAALDTAAQRASPESQAAAKAALLSYVRGSTFKAGAANWFGIHNSAAAIFGLPMGFLALVLVSLLTRRQDAEALQCYQTIRQPPRDAPPAE